MKQLYCLALLAVLFSCKENKETTSENLNNDIPKDTIKIKEVTDKSSGLNLVSVLRPDEKLKLEEVYNDTVEFVNFDGNGDYALFTVQKNKKLISFYTDLADAKEFKRGDILEAAWKMDTIYEAGEGEKQEFAEWLVNAKKLKDGNVSLFRKKHPKPIKYFTDKEDYTADFKDYLYEQVEFYLANSKNELVKTAIQNPNTDLSYSIEEKDREGHSYIVLGISNDFEHHTNIIQWLYMESINRKLYEYDLPNDKLIQFD
jgi:hypothetical protein